MLYTPPSTSKLLVTCNAVAWSAAASVVRAGGDLCSAPRSQAAIHTVVYMSINKQPPRQALALFQHIEISGAGVARSARFAVVVVASSTNGLYNLLRHERDRVLGGTCHLNGRAPDVGAGAPV